MCNSRFHLKAAFLAMVGFATENGGLSANKPPLKNSKSSTALP
jgi:hypothetical protein